LGIENSVKVQRRSVQAVRTSELVTVKSKQFEELSILGINGQALLLLYTKVHQTRLSPNRQGLAHRLSV
jgi:hypothetical protein